VHPRQTRLNTALELKLIAANAALTVSEDLPDRLLALNNGSKVDTALICTTRQGAPLALRHALAVVESGGCIDLVTNYPEDGAALAGLGTESLRTVRAANVCGIPREGAYLHTEVSSRRIAVTGHRGTSADHLKKAMRELGSRATSYSKVITHVLSLRGAAAAIPVLANSGTRALDGRDCIKAVIDLTTDDCSGCASKSA
jgi:2-epi-valiolone-7-phosphate 1-reductase